MNASVLWQHSPGHNCEQRVVHAQPCGRIRGLSEDAGGQTRIKGCNALLFDHGTNDTAHGLLGFSGGDVASGHLHAVLQHVQRMHYDGGHGPVQHNIMS